MTLTKKKIHYLIFLADIRHCSWQKNAWLHFFKLTYCSWRHKKIHYNIIFQLAWHGVAVANTPSVHHVTLDRCWPAWGPQSPTSWKLDWEGTYSYGTLTTRMKNIYHYERTSGGGERKLPRYCRCYCHCRVFSDARLGCQCAVGLSSAAVQDRLTQSGVGDNNRRLRYSVLNCPDWCMVMNQI